MSVDGMNADGSSAVPRGRPCLSDESIVDSCPPPTEVRPPVEGRIQEPVL
jgi:hypothetical protein